MDKDKEKQLTDAFFQGLGILGNHQKAMEVISQQIGILFSELEVNTKNTLASMKAFLEHRGLLLPENFMDFVHWHIYAYPDELDKKGLLAIKQKHIAEYCQIRTKELDSHLNKGIDNGTQPEGLNTNYDADKLNKIFDNLQKKKIVKKGDKVKFAALFTDKFIDKVYWDSTILGAKVGLFDLMERITGEKMTASILKLRYGATDIHDKWRDKNGNPTKLIDKIMEEV